MWVREGKTEESDARSASLRVESVQNLEYLRPDDAGQTVVLVADDEVIVQNFVRITLERHGYFVLTAENGEEALLLSRKYPSNIHLLLSDVRMPIMSGIELSKRISIERPGIRILLMSSDFGEGYPAKVPLLEKPFSPKSLIEAVETLLTGKKLLAGM
jgi:CheY-like chemotaxis protein